MLCGSFPIYSVRVLLFVDLGSMRVFFWYLAIHTPILDFVSCSWSTWLIINKTQIRSTLISRSVHTVLSNSLQPCWLQHTRLPRSSPTPSSCSNSCPLSRWCHPTISSSVVPFSSCLQSFPASGSFGMSQFFASGNQNIGTSVSESVKQIVPGQMLSPILFYCCRFIRLWCFFTQLSHAFKFLFYMYFIKKYYF